MKKGRKNRQKGNKAPGATRPIIATCLNLLGAVIIVGACLAASARNGLHESAIKIASDKVQREMLLHNNSLPTLSSPTDIDSKDTGTLDVAVAEPMPPEAKPAKNRQEAHRVVAQLTDTNSAITYDPWGRIAKLVEPDSSVRQFVYSGDRLCEERDGSGIVTKQFFDWGEIIGGTKYFYTRDHLGSVREMTDQSGNVVAVYTYDPWGNVKRISGAGPDSDFLYAGYFYHRPSGLYITAHRLYSPKLGRWLNRDPIDDPTFAMMPQNPEQGEPSTAAFEQPRMAQSPDMLVVQNATHDPIVQRQLLKSITQSTFGTPIGKPQTNPYTYVTNNPISKRDPSGLDEDWAWCSAYCTLHARGALAWIICMQDCMRGFPKRCPSSP